MVETVLVTVNVFGTKSVVDLAESEWHGKKFYRVQLVTDAGIVERVVSEYEFNKIIETGKATIIKFAKHGRIIE